ncbi:DUF3853 family protein [Bacteroidales bacterium SW292]|nr:DUF3853 family protein [Bacteroidales bacterium SW292]
MSNNLLKEKRLLDMTGEELTQVIREAIGAKSEPALAPKQFLETYPEVPPFITGVKGIADMLGISTSTINRMKADGVLDDAVLQNGKTVIFDTRKLLEALRLSNRKGKYGNFKSNQQISQIWKKK